MSTKFTPQYVLNMLQEVKRLSDQDRFNSTQFKKKYPSFYTFRKILITKGLLRKEKGNEKWISIEPNIIMAKSIVRLYLEHLEKLKEEKPYLIPKKINLKNNTEQILKLKRLEIENAFKRKNPTMSLAKEIRKEGESWKDAQKRASEIVKQKKLLDFNTLTLEELEKITNNKDIISSRGKINVSESELEMLKIKYEQLQEELKRARQGLTNQQIANKCFKQQKEEERKLQAIQNKITNKTPTQKELNLESIIKEKDAEIKRKENENESYKQRIEEVEKGRFIKQSQKELYLEKTIDELRGVIREKTNESNRNESLISNLREKIEAQNEEIYELEDKLMSSSKLSYPDLSSPELDIPEPVFPDTNFEEPIIEDFSTSQEIKPKSSKTYKLFGIPVFSIINK